jgi:hypothetical protein
MKKSAALFALCSLVVGGVAVAQPPFDAAGGPPPPGYYNPGFNPEQRSSIFSPSQNNYGPGMNSYYYSDRDAKPVYFKPTMRYYGNGYVVSYRYVPMYRSEVGSPLLMGESSNFRTEAFRLSPEEVAAWGANSPRVTTKDNSSSGPRSAVTSIVRKKTTTTRASTRSKVKDTGDAPPAIQPSTAPAPAPTQTPTPEPSTPKQ